MPTTSVAENTWFFNKLILYTARLEDGIRNQTDCFLSSKGSEMLIYPGADCSIDHHPMAADFELNLKKA